MLSCLSGFEHYLVRKLLLDLCTKLNRFLNWIFVQMMLLALWGRTAGGSFGFGLPGQRSRTSGQRGGTKTRKHKKEKCETEEEEEFEVDQHVDVLSLVNGALKWQPGEIVGKGSDGRYSVVLQKTRERREMYK